MKYFVHLKDDVVFAFHQSETEIDVEGDNIIQVDGDGEQYLNKKYSNGSFVDAPVIRYAIIDSNNTVVGIKTTVFASEVGNNIVIDNDDVEVLWTWDGTQFNEPEYVGPLPTIWVDSQQITTSELAPAVTAEEMQERLAIANNPAGETGPDVQPQEVPQEFPTE